MDRIFKHIGVPPLDTGGLTRDALDHAFKAKYPLFEEITGWARDAKYVRACRGGAGTPTIARGH